MPHAESDGARLALVPSASHILFSDQPEAVNRAILQFLQDVATG